jgi:hypothetical protein
MRAWPRWCSPSPVRMRTKTRLRCSRVHIVPRQFGLCAKCARPSLVSGLVDYDRWWVWYRPGMHVCDPWGRRHARPPARGGGAVARQWHGGHNARAKWIEEEEDKGQAKSFCSPIHRGTLPWPASAAKVVNVYPNQKREKIIDTVKVIVIGESRSL